MIHWQTIITQIIRTLFMGAICWQGVSKNLDVKMFRNAGHTICALYILVSIMIVFVDNSKLDIFQVLFMGAYFINLTILTILRLISFEIEIRYGKEQSQMKDSDNA